MFNDFMSNLLLAVVVVEGVAVLLLCLPFLSSTVKGMVEWADRQAWLSALRHVVLSVVILLCVMLYGFFSDARGLMGQVQAGGQLSYANVERLVRAELNAALSCVGLILVLLLRNVYSVMAENTRLQKTSLAMEKQARGASAAMTEMMNNPGRMADASKTLAERGEAGQEAERLRRELAEARAECRQLRTRLADFEHVVPGGSKKHQ